MRKVLNKFTTDALQSKGLAGTKENLPQQQIPKRVSDFLLSGQKLLVWYIILKWRRAYTVFTFVKRKNRLSQNTCPHLMFRKEKTYLKYLLSEKASISVLSFIVLNGVPYAKSKEPIIWNREYASNVEVNNNLRPEFYYCFSVVSEPLHTKNNG